MPQQPPPTGGKPSGAPEGEPGGSSLRNLKDIGVNRPGGQLQELGRKDLHESPLRADVRTFQEQYFPGSKYLKRADGAEYILDSTGRTIILFEQPTENGFSSVYSPLTPAELRARIAGLPEEQREQLAQALQLPAADAQAIAQAAASSGGRMEDLLALLKRPLGGAASRGQGQSGAQAPDIQYLQRSESSRNVNM